MDEIISLAEIDERYRLLSDKLLAKMAMRDEMKGLLKIAKPAKIEPIREAVALLDKIIEDTESDLERCAELKQKRLELDEQDAKTLAMMEQMKPELLEFIVENHPERYEEYKDLFDDDGKSH